MEALAKKGVDRNLSSCFLIFFGLNFLCKILSKVMRPIVKINHQINTRRRRDRRKLKAGSDGIKYVLVKKKKTRDGGRDDKQPISHSLWQWRRWLLHRLLPSDRLATSMGPFSLIPGTQVFHKFNSFTGVLFTNEANEAGSYSKCFTIRGNFLFPFFLPVNLSLHQRRDAGQCLLYPS